MATPSGFSGGSEIVVTPNGVYIDGHVVKGVVDVRTEVDQSTGVVEAEIRMHPRSISYGEPPKSAPTTPEIGATGSGLSVADDTIKDIEAAIARAKARREEGHHDGALSGAVRADEHQREVDQVEQGKD